VAEEPAGRGWSKIGPGGGAKVRRNARKRRGHCG